ncbi:MAG TPA: ABC transporter ATP-binding protein [Acidimicrobiia bacterium]|jgi:ABC-type Fe3+/spermidine/putrescine transport system ATPase subunit|nr:ABC transporter ATP-binding protein [Acidimicrobiia bacterium]
MLNVSNLDVVIEGKPILQNVSLEVADSEIVAILGPSGSGKTTLLRAIAGLVDIATGDISWDAHTVAGIPPHRRDFGLMFQGYALFPHLTVFGNVGFGPRMNGAIDIEQKVSEALSWVGLDGFGPRQVDSLSGGEQQRVALARTLAPEPRLVMLDEPLGALDRNLRQQLVIETRQVLEDRDVTAIVVTHDREEAVALSDRLALMRDGSIVQTGRLDQILNNPADDWVTRFIS